jgi:hypothetical protein
LSKTKALWRLAPSPGKEKNSHKLFDSIFWKVSVSRRRHYYISLGASIIKWLASIFTQSNVWQVPSSTMYFVNFTKYHFLLFSANKILMNVVGNNWVIRT